MIKKNLSKIFVLCIILLTTVICNSSYAQAEEPTLTGFITLSNNTKEYSEYIKMQRDGSIQLDATFTDTGTIPGVLDIIVMTRKSELENFTQTVKTITGVTSSQGIQDLKIDLSEGEYLVKFVLHNNAGDDLINTSVKLSFKITKINLPAPESPVTPEPTPVPKNPVTPEPTPVPKNPAVVPII